MSYGTTEPKRRAYCHVNGGDVQGKYLLTPDEDDPTDFFFPPPGQWSHVTWTIGADGAWALYRDGATRDGWKLGSNTNAGCCSGCCSSNGIAAPEMNPVKFGSLGRRDYTASRYFDGTLRDVRIYHRAISAEEVRTLARGMLGTILTDPLVTTDGVFAVHEFYGSGTLTVAEGGGAWRPGEIEYVIVAGGGQAGRGSPARARAAAGAAAGTSPARPRCPRGRTR